MADLILLKKLEWYHRNFDQTGIEKFDQSKWPDNDSPLYGKCGCAAHTFEICINTDKNEGFNCTSLLNCFGFTHSESLYIFGVPSTVYKIAKINNWPLPETPLFTAEEAADRIAYVISRYEE